MACLPMNSGSGAMCPLTHPANDVATLLNPSCMLCVIALVLNAFGSSWVSLILMSLLLMTPKNGSGPMLLVIMGVFLSFVVGPFGSRVMLRYSRIVSGLPGRLSVISHLLLKT